MVLFLKFYHRKGQSENLRTEEKSRAGETIANTLCSPSTLYSKEVNKDTDSLPPHISHAPAVCPAICPREIALSGRHIWHRKGKVLPFCLACELLKLSFLSFSLKTLQNDLLLWYSSHWFGSFNCDIPFKGLFFRGFAGARRSLTSVLLYCWLPLLDLIAHFLLSLSVDLQNPFRRDKDDCFCFYGNHAFGVNSFVTLVSLPSASGGFGVCSAYTSPGRQTRGRHLHGPYLGFVPSEAARLPRARLLVHASVVISFQSSPSPAFFLLVSLNTQCRHQHLTLRTSPSSRPPGFHLPQPLHAQPSPPPHPSVLGFVSSWDVRKAASLNSGITNSLPRPYIWNTYNAYVHLVYQRRIGGGGLPTLPLNPLVSPSQGKGKREPLLLTLCPLQRRVGHHPANPLAY